MKQNLQRTPNSNEGEVSMRANREKTDVKPKRAKKGKTLFMSGYAYYAMLLPFLVLFVLFTVVPIISSMVLSFTDYDMISLPTFVGIKNYLYMFTEDSTIFTVLKNTLLFAVITGPLSYILAFLLAWLINEFRPAVRNLFSFLFYAPALVGASGYLIWQNLFSSDSYGYINNLLISLGLITEPIRWMKDPQYNMIVIMIVQLWMSMGVTFLANLSGLQNVNEELYEAGAIDGVRTRWHELWYITLPSMKSILFFGAVMQIQAVFSIGPLVTVLAGYPSVNHSVDTLVSYITDVGSVSYEMGYAAALSVVLFGIMALFRLLVGNFLKLLEK